MPVQKLLRYGQPISFAHYTALSEAAFAQQVGNSFGDNSARVIKSPIRKDDAGLIRIVNVEAVTIPQGSVFQLSDVGIASQFADITIYNAKFLVGQKTVLCCNELADIPAGETGWARIIGYDKPVAVKVDTVTPPKILGTCGPRSDAGTYTKGLVYSNSVFGLGLTCLSAIDTTNFPYNAIQVVASREDTQIHQGIVTTGYTKTGGFDSFINPGTLIATEYIDTGSAPIPRILSAGQTNLTIVVRSSILSIPVNTYILWADIPMIDGRIEHTLIGADC